MGCKFHTALKLVRLYSHVNAAYRRLLQRYVTTVPFLRGRPLAHKARLSIPGHISTYLISVRLRCSSSYTQCRYRLLLKPSIMPYPKPKIDQRDC